MEDASTRAGHVSGRAAPGGGSTFCVEAPPFSQHALVYVTLVRALGPVDWRRVVGCTRGRVTFQCGSELEWERATGGVRWYVQVHPGPRAPAGGEYGLVEPVGAGCWVLVPVQGGYWKVHHAEMPAGEVPAGEALVRPVPVLGLSAVASLPASRYSEREVSKLLSGFTLRADGGLTIASPARSTHFLSRYYELLYSPATPLSYLVKSALARVKASVESPGAALHQMLLPMSEFDRRHTLPQGLLAQEVSSEEAAWRQRLVGQTPTSDHEGLATQLKLREARMQVVLLFEVMALEGASVPAVPAAPPPPRRTLLVRRKKSKRLVPTLVGGLVDDVVAVAPTGGLFQRLDAWIDRLVVWDALQGHGSKSQDGAIGLVAYTLNPHYGKSHPHLVEYVVKRLKGPKWSGSAPRVKRTKKARRLLVLQHPPLLLRSTLALEDLIAVPLLSRSNSALGLVLLSHLHKRQVDFNAPVERISVVERVERAMTSSSGSAVPGLLATSSERMFTKDSVVLTTATSLSVQVDATPSKKRVVDVPVTPQEPSRKRLVLEEVTSPSDMRQSASDLPSRPGMPVVIPDLPFYRTR